MTANFISAAIAILLCANVSTLQGVSILPSLAQQTADQAKTKTVLVELFTSEGCSTCPPADELLTALEQKQPVEGVQIIVLSEHVDYWNQLGWFDPFSSFDFSERQRDYARALGDVRGIYTPQMIVDGRVAFIGSRADAALDAIARLASAAKANVRVTITNLSQESLTVSVQVGEVLSLGATEAPEVMVAITESELQSSVSRGENAGRKLTHSAVVRKLLKIGAVSGDEFNQERTIKLGSKWKRANLKVVAFVQGKNSRRVVGSAAASLREFEIKTTAGSRP